MTGGGASGALTSGGQVRAPDKPHPQSRAPRLATLLRGFVALTVGIFAGQVIGFLVLAVVARRIGPTGLGAYTFATSFIMYFKIPIDLGVSMFAVREMASHPLKTREIVGDVLSLRILIMLPCLAAALIAGELFAPNAAVRSVMPIVAAGLVPIALTMYWVMQAQGSLATLGVITAFSQVTYALLALLLVTGGLAGVRTYAALNLLSVVMIALIPGVIVWRRSGFPKLNLDIGRHLHRYRRGLALGISMVCIMIYFNIDALMVGYLRGSRAVGLYGAAYKLPFAIVSVAGIWIGSFYPHASKLALTDREALRRQIGWVASLAVVICLPLALGGTVVAEPLMTAMFGSAFRGAGGAFALLMWSASLVLVTANFGNAIWAVHDERRYIARVLAATAINVGLNFFLIPAFGIEGAAASTIVAELVLLSLLMRRVWSLYGGVQLEYLRILRGCVAAGVMALLVSMAPSGWSVWITILLGAVVYVCLALALRVISPDELRTLIRRRSKRPSSLKA
jgi:O-antigen/teichoic acid export membrane protein